MSDNVTRFPTLPRSVRPAPDPLGLYLRIGRNDHRELLNFLATGDGACFGAVLDPVFLDRHKELRAHILDRRLDAILDPKTQQSATPGGYTDALGVLPWGVARVHTQADFADMSGWRLMAALGDFVMEHGFTQVLAPTHVIRAADDPWLRIDSVRYASGSRPCGWCGGPLASRVWRDQRHSPRDNFRRAFSRLALA